MNAFQKAEAEYIADMELFNGPTVTIKEEWHETPSNIHQLAHHLAATNILTNPEDTIYYYQKPWKWTIEWNQLTQTNETASPKHDETTAF